LITLLKSFRMAAQFTVYKKQEEELDEYSSSSKGGAKKKKGRSPTAPTATASLPPKEEEPSFFPKKEPKKGQDKFVPLFSKDGREAEVVKLAGRHPCECQAVKHSLVSNCLGCGRVVCSQEGSGPCLFCATLVCTREEQAVLDRKSKKSEQLLKRLGGDGRDEYQASQQKALENKERLLEYDANCEKRTRVIDDESDYFAVDTNKWLTPQQREALQKKKEELHAEKHKSRLDRRITFDFAGRKVVEEEGTPQYDFEQDTKLLELFKNDAFSVASEIQRRAEEGSIANPNTGDRGRPIYTESVRGRDSEGGRQAQGPGRVQDGGLLEMSDMGNCMSMHQPLASLLVMGIKIHEGRTWYSQHRGRLWIHAGSKEPSPEDIAAYEQFYRGRRPGVTFPAKYPTSCLLGSVDVTDWLAQEEYRETHPTGESASPYVAVCTNPQELVLKFPMKGEHKIFKLESGLHSAAKKTAKKGPAL